MWSPNGSLRIIDRKNNLIKLAQADFVSPEQVEVIYLQHPLVKQVSFTKNVQIFYFNRNKSFFLIFQKNIFYSYHLKQFFFFESIYLMTLNTFKTK